VVLVADHQTAGRGRQSRSFYDEPGAAMLMSVLLRPPVEVAPLVPFLMGMAAVEGVGDAVAPADRSRASATSSRLALKWPNDVLVPELGDRKLAGILTEATTVVGGPPAGSTRPTASPDLVVVAGIGLNLRWTSPPPIEVAERAATLQELTGQEIDRWELVRAVLTRLDRWLDRVESGDRSGVMGAYRSRCCSIGRTVVIETPSGLVEGVANEVTRSGALQVETSDGPVEVLAGDAHHRR
jgi:BirA family biotin operon repressor/biotin-[acetyl-CoA-carboxylase] ligase